MSGFIHALMIVSFVAFAAYGVGTATDQLLGSEKPPTIYKRVHIVTNAGCRL